MAKPKFTDEARYPVGYRPASKTDITRTFARERALQKAVAEVKARELAELAAAVAQAVEVTAPLPEPLPGPVVSDYHVFPMRRRTKG